MSTLEAIKEHKVCPLKKTPLVEVHKEVIIDYAASIGVAICEDEIGKFIGGLSSRQTKAFDYVAAAKLRLSNPDAAYSLWGKSTPFVFMDHIADGPNKHFGSMVLKGIQSTFGQDMFIYTDNDIDVGTDNLNRLEDAPIAHHENTNLVLYARQYGEGALELPIEYDLGWGAGRLNSLLLATIMVISNNPPEIPSSYPGKEVLLEKKI